MKRIKLSEYNKFLGELIDVEDQYTYSKGHHPDSINIPYQKLSFNYKTLLDKSKPYYIMSLKFIKSDFFFILFYNVYSDAYDTTI